MGKKSQSGTKNHTHQMVPVLGEGIYRCFKCEFKCTVNGLATVMANPQVHKYIGKRNPQSKLIYNG